MFISVLQPRFFPSVHQSDLRLVAWEYIPFKTRKYHLIQEYADYWGPHQPPSIPSGFTLVGPLDKYEKRICNNQKVRSASGTISFSVLGVAIILILGAILILTNLLLDTILGFVRRKLHWKDHKSLQWALDEKLQLQRLAYEEAGQGRWSGGASGVPVTIKGDVFGVPGGVDRAHPRLGRVGRQAAKDGGGVPESEGLMDQKGMNYGIEPM